MTEPGFAQIPECPTCNTGMWGGTRARPRCRNIRCAVGLAFLEREKATRARRDAIRRPPEPPFPGERGICRLCGIEVERPRRSWCGPRCLRIHEIARFPDMAAAELRAFFAGCWACFTPEFADGRHTGISLEVDHVRPLWSLTDDERRELRWWLPFNLQLLCAICHKAKTRTEAAQRAAAAAALARIGQPDLFEIARADG